MIQNTRIRGLNNKPVEDGRYVVYWMQQSQREDFNHALEYAVLTANSLKKPLVVYFGVTDDFPEANFRHYVFMLQGLFFVKKVLEARKIKFVIEKKSPEKGIVEFCKNASCLIIDRGYLRVQKKWRDYVLRNLAIRVTEVESDVVVPVEEASFKEEYAAYTIRKKINSRLLDYLVPLKKEKLNLSSLNFTFDVPEFDSVEDFMTDMDLLNIDACTQFPGGTDKAYEKLDAFLENKLLGYDIKRNDPNLDFTSGLSPYLHFGQISPVYIALKANEYNGEGVDAFLEELIVRRELAMNFVNFNPYYDSFDCLPDWAKNTLTAHKNDKRVYIYSTEEFELAKTHDRYWNAAQVEMVKTGKMHGYMRMYWGKKILEWSVSPEKAFQTALYLNNKYSLDGRDPNAFAGVAWCFGKHDRPWKERDIFGKIRYMNAKGLKRKFNADLYASNLLQNF